MAVGPYVIHVQLFAALSWKCRSEYNVKCDIPGAHSNTVCAGRATEETWQQYSTENRTPRMWSVHMHNIYIVNQSILFQITCI